MSTIYLDYAASTPVDPRVVAAMAECLGGTPGNPASATHAPGLAAADLVEAARANVAALIGATAREVIFTSGATEANNLALLGVARAARRAGAGRGHIVSSRTEHKSVLDVCKQLEKEGFAISLVEPDDSGRVLPETLGAALRADTLLASLMLANNEIGVVSDVAAIAGIAVSSGSACSSATREPSYVLRSLGRSTELAQSSLRLSLGRFTTAADVDEAATAIRAEVARLRVLAGAPGVAELPPSGNAGGDSLMARTLSPLTKRYFLAAARVPQFPEGALPPDVRQGRAGRAADGTEVLFELRVADGIVKSARFSAYGCPHTVAVAGWLCEVIEGSRLAAVPSGAPADWASRFEVPAEKLGRLLIVEDALRLALVD